MTRETNGIFEVLFVREINKLPRDVRHLKFKGAMQMSEKVGRLGRGL